MTFKQRHLPFRCSVRSQRAHMAKISQDEWNAIAARYSKGELLSSIARHYGCTAPAIPYVLERIKGLTIAPDDAAPLPTGPATETVPDDRRAGQSATPITTMKDTMGEVQPLPSRQPRIEQVEPRRAPCREPRTKRATAAGRSTKAARREPGAGPDRWARHGAASPCGSRDPILSFEFYRSARRGIAGNPRAAPTGSLRSDAGGGADDDRSRPCERQRQTRRVAGAPPRIRQRSSPRRGPKRDGVRPDADRRVRRAGLRSHPRFWRRCRCRRAARFPECPSAR